MNLEFSPEDLAFRDEVRTFIAENYPEQLRGKQDEGDDLGKDDFLAWHKVLAKKGWVAPSWPKEWGGTSWTPTQKYIWSEELARADAIAVLPFGINMVSPVIYTFGTKEQKEKFLPATYNGEIWWCQGYSEPGAGSDLASLKTKAERITGDDGKEYYIVNGQKTWTTLAQFADWGFFLVRTDPTAKIQEGISFLLIDMKTPGITVRPIITMDGSHEVNEVWLENVKVPVENRVFEENKGWTCAKFLLAHERSGIAGVARSKRGIERIREMAGTEFSDDGESLIKDASFKRKVAELEIDLTALEYTELRTLASESAGKGPGPESSLLKIKGTEIQQRITDLALEAAGHYGAPYFRGFPDDGDNAHPIGPDYAHRTAPNYFNTRKTSIYGGSNEIQRNIIAKMVLGL
ncbi:alkylation response protein AidB-like acyl-CoA dehydrogenase [Caulobacter ginsengisoli]|uniref:Alkylation response protein AidB-like acyl-CoA dehydrogenase n=1 Tax=Caulobacter ginsengisoli TaxID=400775 RepID=A0ABU0IXI8_9CAUL|nr:acyl-CoA dehydrogenase family protein [Caulobacter ginsengisoli]MDQ0466714.1 alkylation response protein AidB-like acyl-CoA dehydrogenase [Caulobacter ginsengisoli]